MDKIIKNLFILLGILTPPPLDPTPLKSKISFWKRVSNLQRTKKREENRDGDRKKRKIRHATSKRDMYIPLAAGRNGNRSLPQDHRPRRP